MHADRHFRLFPAAVSCSLFDGFENLGQFIAEENGNDCGRRFKPSKAVIVSGTGHGGPQQILILIHRLDYAHQKKKELCAVIRTVPRLQKIVSGIRGQTPVIVFPAAVNPFERLFVEKAIEPVPVRNLFHDFHGQLIMVAGYIDSRIDWSHLMLGRRGFIVFRLRQYAKLPQFLVQL